VAPGERRDQLSRALAPLHGKRGQLQPGNPSLDPAVQLFQVAGLELDAGAIPNRDDRSQWDALRALFAKVFRTRTRDEWAARFAGRDACVAPVLTLAEAPEHPHNVARGTFVEVDGVRHPAPAPRLDRTPGALAVKACYAGQHTDEVLHELGYGTEEIAGLRRDGAVA
jgi:alpha-methylacyl-CoA racemase